MRTTGDIISQYLFMLKTNECTPFVLPKYYRSYNGSKIAIEAIKLRCFMHNHLPKLVSDTARSEVQSAILNWDITTPDELIDFFNRKQDQTSNLGSIVMYKNIVAGVNEVKETCDICDYCDKHDWSEEVGKFNT